jgi:Uma2 family endonuclease
MNLVEPRIKRWTRDEYYQMADLGWFRSKRACLLSGEIYEIAGQGNWHSVGIGMTEDLLRDAFPRGDFWVRPQMPVDLSDGVSEPEPDLAVVPGTPESYTQHPSTAVLIVEVADTSLSLDRKKAAYYAGAGVPEYWILNLRDRVLEVYRQPVWRSEEKWRPDSAPDATYNDSRVLKPGDVIIPVAAPTSTIAVVRMFPARPLGETF